MTIHTPTMSNLGPARPHPPTGAYRRSAVLQPDQPGLRG